MLRKSTWEERIKLNIFMLPILSVLILSIIISIILVTYLKDKKDNDIQETKKNLIEIEKKASKNSVLEIEKEIEFEIKNLNKNMGDMLKSRINEASSIIYKILEENHNKSQKEIKTLIKQILGSIRYNKGRGYYYIYDFNTKVILVHPIKKFLHVDATNMRDQRGTLIIKGDVKIAKGEGEGFKHLYFAKPNFPNQEFEKINYIKYIKELNWIVGTGEYIEDAKKELQNKILKRIENKRGSNANYFWVHDTNYTLLAHPYRQKDIGKNDENLTDSQGTKIIKLFVDSSLKKPDGVFVEYFWQKPNETKMQKKLSFIKKIKNWNWVIGSGVYLEDIQKQMLDKKETINKEIKQLYMYLALFMGISLVLVSLFSFFLSSQAGKLFKIYKEDLEHRIEKAVKENIKKDKILQQQSKLAAMGEMIGAIAHQWRQPLNALNINIQNLDDDYADGFIDEKFLDNFIEKNKKIIQFMSNTIDDFRNFFRVDKEATLFSARKNIQSMLNIQSAILKNHNIDIEIIGDDFDIFGFESEFKQVILNIVNNAKDVLIENNIEKPKITITLSKNEISILDNAGGVAEDVIEHIFEPYYTTKEQGKGTGMGLYMSKMIIEENMKGELDVVNEENGAKFIIKFKSTL